MTSPATSTSPCGTEKATENLLKKLGLQAADGSGPFDLAPPGAVAPRQLPAAPGSGFPAPSAAYSLLERAVQRSAALRPPADDSRCRAAVSRFGPRCAVAAIAPGPNGLCLTHSRSVTRGQAVYDWESRQPIR